MDGTNDGTNGPNGTIPRDIPRDIRRESLGLSRSGRSFFRDDCTGIERAKAARAIVGLEEIDLVNLQVGRVTKRVLLLAMERHGWSDQHIQYEDGEQLIPLVAEELSAMLHAAKCLNLIADGHRSCMVREIIDSHKCTVTGSRRVDKAHSGDGHIWFDCDTVCYRTGQRDGDTFPEYYFAEADKPKLVPGAVFNWVQFAEVGSRGETRVVEVCQLVDPEDRP